MPALPCGVVFYRKIISQDNRYVKIPFEVFESRWSRRDGRGGGAPVHVI